MTRNGKKGHGLRSRSGKRPRTKNESGGEENNRTGRAQRGRGARTTRWLPRRRQNGTRAVSARGSWPQATEREEES